MSAPADNFDTGKAQFNLGGAGFNPNSGSFVPKGTFNAHTMDDAPSLDDLMDEPKKGKGGKAGKKKGKKTVVVAEKKEENELTEEQAATPWKGKKSDFFIMKQDESKAGQDP